MVKDKLLKVFAALFSLLGVISVVLALTGIRALSSHAVWFLQSKYGSEEGMYYQDYEALYGFAMHILEKGNSYFFSFYIMLGIFLIILGGTFLLWSIDRKRLLKKQDSN